MAMVIEHEGWRIRPDRRATVQAHDRIPGSDTQGCCTECDSFVAARHLAYPPDFLALLRRLGIPAAHEAHVYSLGPYEAGRYAYGGWFHFVGAIEHDPLNLGNLIPVDTEGQGFNFWFHDRAALVPDAFRGLPVVQLEFTTWVPWLLDDGTPAEGR